MKTLSKVTALIAAAALTFSLSACAATSDASFAGLASTCDPFVGGTGVDKINVSGSAGAVPTVKFDLPLTSDKIETKVITEGDGPAFIGDQFVELEFMAINGSTGETLQATKFNGTDFSAQVIASGSYPDFCHAISGAKQGSRLAVLFPAAFAHNSEGNEESGLAKNDSVVYVIEVRRVYLPYAVGEAQSEQSGFPSVVRAENGTPGITQLKSDAPAEFKMATLIKGAGDTVTQGDTVTLHYSGFVWGGEKFDSSWDRGQPAQFELAAGQLIEGFIKALDGQTVGSQVIAVIPPSEGYGEQEQGSIPANSTLIFVIDILGTTKPAN
jgi:peptidylprolyl isomerase